MTNMRYESNNPSRGPTTLPRGLREHWLEVDTDKELHKRYQPLDLGIPRKSIQEIQKKLLMYDNICFSQLWNEPLLNCICLEWLVRISNSNNQVCLYVTRSFKRNFLTFVFLVMKRGWIIKVCFRKTRPAFLLFRTFRYYFSFRNLSIMWQFHKSKSKFVLNSDLQPCCVCFLRMNGALPRGLCCCDARREMGVAMKIDYWRY